MDENVKNIADKSMKSLFWNILEIIEQNWRQMNQ